MWLYVKTEYGCNGIDHELESSCGDGTCIAEDECQMPNDKETNEVLVIVLSVLGGSFCIIIIIDIIIGCILIFQKPLKFISENVEAVLKLKNVDILLEEQGGIEKREMLEEKVVVQQDFLTIDVSTIKIMKEIKENEEESKIKYLFKYRAKWKDIEVEWKK